MRWTILWLVVATQSCMNLDEEEAAAEAKFLTYVQAKGAKAKSYSLLRKAHSDTLTIRYGFAPGCGSKYSDAQVERDITKVMRLWLSALRDWPERPSSEVIVDSFTYLKGTANDLRQSSGGRYYRTFSEGGDSDLSIVFYCARGRAFIFYTRNPPQIHMYEKANGRYSLATLTHEIGHALGLTDTYVEYERTRTGRLVEEEHRWRYNQSDCGSQKIIGCQPLSVMNIHTWLIEDSAIALGKDDVAGLRWLYRYLLTGDVACPLDFISEINTGGCIPKDPLAFAMKQGDIDNTIELLAEQGLPIDTQDEKGNTVLHYAAQRAASHGIDLYGKGLSAGADPDIENKEGITPREMLFPAIEKAIQSKKLYIAEPLISHAIID